MLKGALAFAIRGVTKPHRRWRRITPRAIIAHVGPQAPRFGFARARSEDGDRRIVGVDLHRRLHIRPDRLSERHEKGARSAHEACESGAIQLNAFSSIDLALAVQGGMIAIFGDQDMGEESGASNAALDRSAWSRGLHNLLAAAAGEFGANMPNHLEVPLHVLEDLAHILTQCAQFAPAGRAVTTGCNGRVNYGLARQVRGKRFAHGLHLRLRLRPCGGRRHLCFARF
jgi:hypothetical protein